MGQRLAFAASAKHHGAFKIVALCVCIAAVSSGLIDLSAGYHRVGPACFSAAATCYFANSLWPHRWFQIVAVVLSMAAISSFAGLGHGEVPRRGGACSAGRHFVLQSNIFLIDEGICRRFAHLEANGQLFVQSVCGEMDASKRRHGLP
jgi:hypothetical protein